MANLTISPTVVKVLQVIQVGKPVTPTEINNHVGDGDYASKHVWYLGKLGFQFSIQKDGRKVSSYTLIAEPANAAAIRNTVHGAVKVKAPRAPKAAKAPKAKVIKSAPADVKAKNLETMKKVAARVKASNKKVREFDDVTQQLGSSGEVATSFSVDRDWDSIEGLDLQKLVG